jgi:putative transposase
LPFTSALVFAFCHLWRWEKSVNENAVVVFEDLQVDNMRHRPKPKQDENGKYLPNGAAAKGGLNKSILDAGWSAFVALCASKAEEAGCTVVKVAPHDTSQVCSSPAGVW